MRTQKQFGAAQDEVQFDLSDGLAEELLVQVLQFLSLGEYQTVARTLKRRHRQETLASWLTKIYCLPIVQTSEEGETHYPRVLVRQFVLPRAPLELSREADDRHNARAGFPLSATPETGNRIDGDHNPAFILPVGAVLIIVRSGWG